MQTVSADWITAQTQNIVPLSDIKIKYAATDIDAMDYATVSSNSVASVVDNDDLQSIIVPGTTFVPKASAELNKWGLGGDIIVNNNNSYGYVSGYISGNNNSFATAPTVTLTFSQTRTIQSQGVVIRWSEAFDEYATDFVVRAYLNSTQVATKTVTGNTSVTSEVAITIQNYNKIVITINKWCLPQSRARIENITIGSTKTFTKADIISYKQNMTSSLFAYQLPDYNIEFEFDNSNDEWNPDNPSGVYQSLAVRQEIQVKYGFYINGAFEYISGGTYFLSEWNTPQNGITARFKARDLTIFMQDKFIATNYSGQVVTYQALATAAFTQSGIPTLANGNVRWDVSDLSSTAVTMPDLSGYTCAEIVQLCCSASSCIMRYGRDGIMYCEKLTSTLKSYSITRFNSYQDAEYEMSQVLRGININNGQYTDTVTTTGEIQYINNPLLQDASQYELDDLRDYTELHLGYRRTLTGEYRCDPRLDVFDYITVTNKYASMKVVITTLNIAYNGAFSATYEGRVES